ncbi:histidine phosphatase family protein [Actinomycetaceae bacterium L2_0104]
MSASRVILWRHGQTDLNVQARIQGSQDFPLNDVGRAQAAAISKEIAAMEPVRILSSPLSRASDTAQYVADRVGVPIELDSRLRERDYGEWEGLDGSEIHARNPEQHQVWRDGGHPSGLGIERNTAVGQRVAAAVNEASEQMEDGTLLVTAHGAAIRAGVAALLDLSSDVWTGLRGLDNCHWALLVPQSNRNPKWCLMYYNQMIAPQNAAELTLQVSDMFR